MNQAERAELVADIAAAIKASSTLSEDEVRWVKLAIEKQEQSINCVRPLSRRPWVAWCGLRWLGWPTFYLTSQKTTDSSDRCNCFCSSTVAQYRDKNRVGVPRCLAERKVWGQ